MIRFKDIIIKYGDFVAMNNLNLHIKEGEFFSFLGPSGSGKTTVLNTLVGFLQSASGTITIGDQDITNVPIEKRNIGIVFQSYALFPTMNVYENIAYGLRAKRYPKKEIDPLVRDIAKKVDLTDEQLLKKVSELSGGQQQRVAIARAMVTKPKILCLDEPLSNLDAKLRVKLRQEIKKLQKEFGITTIYVTHDQEEALTLSDRMAIFDNGNLQQVGTPKEIYTNPQTEFVQNFIGETNQLPGKAFKEFLQEKLEIDETKPVYISIHNIRTEKKHKDSIELKGEIKGIEYFGLYMKYTLQVTEELQVRFIQFIGVGKEHELGEAVSIYVDPENIRQY